MSKSLQQADEQALRWYESRENNGRGRLTGATARLAKAGLISVSQTGYYTWVARLSDKGRAFLSSQAVQS